VATNANVGPFPEMQLSFVKQTRHNYTTDRSLIMLFIVVSGCGCS